ncbi:MAG: phenol hydroxylase subunit P4 [Sinobacteraceae bacterium]|nr:phenol hydroxylase subunit P4 [Nevskiaceae bacterium]
MSVVSLEPGYHCEVADRVENFHGQQLLYIGWEDHLLYCAPLCIPVDPDMPFSKLPSEIIPDLYDLHPDMAKVDWDKVEWFSSGEPFSPDPAKSVTENSLGHKAVLRFRTPGLTGIGGSCS